LQVESILNALPTGPNNEAYAFMIIATLKLLPGESARAVERQRHTGAERSDEARGRQRGEGGIAAVGWRASANCRLLYDHKHRTLGVLNKLRDDPRPRLDAAVSLPPTATQAR
jgi:hypothetical protein